MMASPAVGYRQTSLCQLWDLGRADPIGTVQPSQRRRDSTCTGLGTAGSEPRLIQIAVTAVAASTLIVRVL